MVFLNTRHRRIAGWFSGDAGLLLLQESRDYHDGPEMQINKTGRNRPTAARSHIIRHYEF